MFLLFSGLLSTEELAFALKDVFLEVLQKSTNSYYYCRASFVLRIYLLEYSLQFSKAGPNKQERIHCGIPTRLAPRWSGLPFFVLTVDFLERYRGGGECFARCYG